MTKLIKVPPKPPIEICLMEEPEDGLRLIIGSLLNLSPLIEGLKIKIY